MPGTISGPSSKKALILCLFQSLAGLIFGWSNSSGGVLFAMDNYKNTFGSCTDAGCVVTTTRQSAITGLLSFGAMVGAITSGAIADRIGLRLTCMIFIFIHMVGSAVETSSHIYQQLYFARVLLGLGIGATSGLVPVFQSEAAPPAYRSIVTSSFQMCVTLGIWGVSMCGWGMRSRASPASWRVTCGIVMAFDALLLAGFLLMPESPRFLARKGKWEACRRSLASIRSQPLDSSVVDSEMETIRHEVEADLAKGEVSYRECFSMRDRILWRVMIGLCVQVGQQITGINFFFSYGVQFAQTAGLTDAYIFQIILASVNVASAGTGLLFVERAGRRRLLIGGAFIMFVGQIVTGAVSEAYPHAVGAGKVLIAFCCFFVAAFATTWGPCGWIVCAETFPNRLASRCVTLGAGANWLSNMIIALAAPKIQEKIGTGITFVWAGCLALDMLFSFFCVPETKGKSIEEIDEMYLSGVPAWKTDKKAAVSTDLEGQTQPAEMEMQKSHQEHAQHHDAHSDTSTTVGDAHHKPEKPTDTTHNGQ